jgi:eukaryotic translation initiation factor 2C
MAVWNAPEVKSRLQKMAPGPWLWNGDKIAWSSCQIEEQRWNINMDTARGRTPRAGRESEHVLIRIKGAKVIAMSSLYGFLNRKSPFDDICLEGISKSFLLTPTSPSPLSDLTSDFIC